MNKIKNLIDLALSDLFDERMLANLASHAAISATDYEHLLRVGMCVEWQERDHLLVRVLVQLGALDSTVQDQHISKCLAIINYKNE